MSTSDTVGFDDYASENDVLEEIQFHLLKKSFRRKKDL